MPAKMDQSQNREIVKTIKKSKKEPLRRPRGKRGGVKNRKDKIGKVDKKGKQNITKVPMHASQIAIFHTLEKKLAQTQDEKERLKIIAQQNSLGGLQAYQDASLFGADKQRGGETGKWCAQQLMQIRGKEKIRLLDVGALSGTAYEKYDWIQTTSIDLNPRNGNVLQYDFLHYPIPDENDQDKFQVVALSLVINFVGDLADRGRMLIRAHQYFQSNQNGFLFLVLPLACIQNSRYCDHARLRAILTSCGWGDVVRQHDSARLTHWLCKETSKSWDGKVWKKEEIKKGISLNNFCIIVR